MLSQRLGRSRNSSLLIAGSTLLLLGFYLIFERWYGIRLATYLIPTSPKQPNLQTSPKQLDVAIVNGVPFHFEVVMPFLYAISRQPRVANLELVAKDEWVHYLDASPFLENATHHSHLPLQIREPLAVEADVGWSPDVMVLVSCLSDHEFTLDTMHSVERVLMQNPSARAICVIHETEKWKDEGSRHVTFLEKWAPSGQLSLLVLSQHVKIALESRLEDLGIQADILEPLVPVFPIEDDVLGYDPMLPQEMSLSIPGKYEVGRRDYQPIFLSFEKHVDEFTDLNVTLNLVGIGDRPTVPDSVAHLQQFHDSLDFDDYWGLLRRSLVITPAFATEHYIQDKASSSIPTALIAGVPLLCTADVLEAYTFLDEEDVWLMDDDESVGDGFLRVIQQGEAEWARKRRLVSQRRTALEQLNIAMFNDYLEQSVEVS